MTAPANSGSILDKLRAQSAWYGAGARGNHSRYVALKTTQIILAAAIPVVAVAAAGVTLQWTTAILGALVGIIEGILQLGQYQQNWLLYRATREALKREDFLHEAKAGPYATATDADTLYVERADAIISGENTRWITSQQQTGGKK
jgi:hypothetical protein